MKQMMISLVSALVVCSSLAAGLPPKKVENEGSAGLNGYFEKVSNQVVKNEADHQLAPAESAPAIKSSESEILLRTEKSVAAQEETISPVNRMMLTLFGLILIAGAIFAALQKWGRKVGHSSLSNNIKVLTQKSIGPKKQLMLIRVAGETILLGVTDQNINHIRTLSLMEDELPQFTEPQFSGQLKEKIEQTKISDEVEDVDGFSVSNINQVKDEVTKRYAL